MWFKIQILCWAMWMAQWVKVTPEQVWGLQFDPRTLRKKSRFGGIHQQSYYYYGIIGGRDMNIAWKLTDQLWSMYCSSKNSKKGLASSKWKARRDP